MRASEGVRRKVRPLPVQAAGQFEIVSEAWIGVLRHGMGAREGERCTSVRSDSARWHRWVGLLSSVKAAVG